MLGRCLVETDRHYPNWGGRGITVCERWQGESGFANFLADMGERPPGRTLDRVDNDKGYCKENCRWATSKEQRRNSRQNTFVTWQGRTQCVADWAKELGMSSEVLLNRLQKWPLERAMTEKLGEFRGTLYEYNGKKQTLRDWSKEVGIPYVALRARIKDYGWSLEQALLTPSKKRQC